MIDLATAHAALMIAAWVLFTAGFLLARFVRKRRWWLKVHRSLGVAGALVVLSGFFAQVIDIALTGREHFTIVHAYVGAVAVGLAVLTPALGHLQFRLPAAAPRVRVFHRWSGRVTISLMLINILLGLSYIGLL